MLKLKDEITYLKDKVEKGEKLYKLATTELIDANLKISLLNSEIDKEKTQSTLLEETLRTRDIKIVDLEKQVLSYKESLYSSELDIEKLLEANKKLKEKNDSLKLMHEEMSQKIILNKENEVVKELDEAYVYLKSIKIEVSCFMDVKSRMKSITTNLDNYREVWRKDFETTKRFFEELTPNSNVNDAFIGEKIIRLISLLRKLKMLADLEIIWKERNDELTFKISEFKKLLEN